MKKQIIAVTSGLIIGFGLAWTGASQLDNVEHQVVRMEHMIRTMVSEISDWENLTADQRERIEYLENMIGSGENYYGDNSGLLGEILRLESELRQANEDAQHLYDSANIWYQYARESFDNRLRMEG